MSDNGKGSLPQRPLGDRSEFGSEYDRIFYGHKDVFGKNVARLTVTGVKTEHPNQPSP